MVEEPDYQGRGRSFVLLLRMFYDANYVFEIIVPISHMEDEVTFAFFILGRGDALTESLPSTIEDLTQKLFKPPISRHNLSSLPLMRRSV